MVSMENDLVEKLSQYAGRKVELSEVVYGSASTVKSICFVQLIAYVEDRYLGNDELDLFEKITKMEGRVTLSDFCKICESCA